LARKRLPEALAQKVLYDSAYACSICQSTTGLHVHHVDKDNSNNVETNLVVLCQSHHDEAHTHHELSRNLTGSRINTSKKTWLEEVQRKRSQIATRSGNKEILQCDFISTQWGYINHSRVAQTVIDPKNDGEGGALFKNCRFLGTVDEKGRILRPRDLSPPKSPLHGTIYDWFPHTHDWHLHALYSNYVDELAKRMNPFHVTDQSWKKSLLKNQLVPGRAAFLNRGFYFKQIETCTDHIQLKVHTFKTKIEFIFQANTRDMFGTTSIVSSFSGHKSAAAFVVIKSQEEVNGKLVFHCTPIAMGVGFLVKSPLEAGTRAE
jgi:hypothetical protein